jgi:hypothetical protein
MSSKCSYDKLTVNISSFPRIKIFFSGKKAWSLAGVRGGIETCATLVVDTDRYTASGHQMQTELSLESNIECGYIAFIESAPRCRFGASYGVHAVVAPGVVLLLATGELTLAAPTSNGGEVDLSQL